LLAQLGYVLSAPRTDDHHTITLTTGLRHSKANAAGTSGNQYHMLIHIPFSKNNWRNAWLTNPYQVKSSRQV
jgi:hypothetical protein